MKIIIFFSIKIIIFLNLIFTQNNKIDPKYLIELSNELNALCPLMLDKETRLDATITINGEFKYNYTLINKDITDLDIDYLKNYQKELATNKFCTSPDMESFRKFNIITNWDYYDKNGNFIMNIKVNPDMCSIKSPSMNFKPGWEDPNNWRKLKIGMSPYEVKAILGEPHKIDISVSTYSDTESWYWNYYSKSVTFKYSTQKLERFNF